MKLTLLHLGLATSLLASTAVAAPKVTEIRLRDSQGYVAPPRINNEFVFRADGNLYWIEGTEENPVRHRYSIGAETFQKLAAALETHQFFALKPRYEAPITDGPQVVVSVMRGGQKKEVVDYRSSGPSNLWELEMIVRGAASQWTGLRRAPVASAKPTSNATDVPVIRGTKQAAN